MRKVWVLGVALMFWGCADRDTATEEAQALFERVTTEGYASSACTGTVSETLDLPGCPWWRDPYFASPRESHTAHGDTVQVYFNRPLYRRHLDLAELDPNNSASSYCSNSADKRVSSLPFDSQRRWPVGSIAVKDAYADGSLTHVAIMEKLPLTCQSDADCDVERDAEKKRFECVEGTCNARCETTCRAGLVSCSGTCKNPDTDKDFCGARSDCSAVTGVPPEGTVCAEDEVCIAGSCGTCPAGLLKCGQQCVDPLTSEGNCGASADCLGDNAGTACELSETCVSGVCVETPCPAGLLRCGIQCVDPQSSKVFCGASADCAAANAGTTCATGEICDAGSCVADCSSGILCNEVCVDPQSHATFCGASGDCTGDNAGTECEFTEECEGGTCVTVQCTRGEVLCNGVCVDPDTNLAFCGASGDCQGANAGVACANGEVCLRGTCTSSCPGGQVVCDGVCVDPQIDEDHCGADSACSGGSVCVAGEICADGACVSTCPRVPVQEPGEWFYSEHEPDGTVKFSGQPNICAGCHERALHDHLFTARWSGRCGAF